MTAMNTRDAYSMVLEHHPQLIHINGKTCTGKSTFASGLTADCNYRVIELDQIVSTNIIDVFGLQQTSGDVFRTVYKTADNDEWMDIFVSTVRTQIQNLRKQDNKVIVDGALANPKVIRAIFDDYPETMYLYFHPEEGSALYRQYLKDRFMNATARHRNGLPNAFWDCIDKPAFARFCQDRILTPQLREQITQYANRSSQDSVSRLKLLQESIPSFLIVRV